MKMICLPASLSVRLWLDSESILCKRGKGMKGRIGYTEAGRSASPLWLRWKSPVALRNTSPSINPHEQANNSQGDTFKKLCLFLVRIQKRVHTQMHKMLIHYYAGMGVRTQRQRRDLKATQEVFLQGWAKRKFCLTVFFILFCPSIIILTGTLQKEFDKSEVES